MKPNSIQIYKHYFQLALLKEIEPYIEDKQWRYLKVSIFEPLSMTFFFWQFGQSSIASPFWRKKSCCLDAWFLGYSVRRTFMSFEQSWSTSSWHDLYVFLETEIQFLRSLTIALPNVTIDGLLYWTLSRFWSWQYLEII